MNGPMNDAELDRLIGASDPYEPTDLGGADTELMEQILREPAVDPLVLVRARRVRRNRVAVRTRLAISLATAAAVGGVFLAPQLFTDEPDGSSRQVAAPDAQDAPVTEVRYMAAAVKVAEANPRALVTVPGWSVTHVGGFEPDDGDISFQGGRIDDPSSLDVHWRPRDSYQGYKVDRMDQPTREVSVWGEPAMLVTYSDNDHAVMMQPEGDVFLEIRGGHLGGEAEFLSFLDESVERVDVETWLAALPPEVVTVGGVDREIDRILADIPLPPGFERPALEVEAVQAYRVGAQVMDVVMCGWADEWKRATDAGDRSAADAAKAQLPGTRDWKVLQEMESEGEYAQGIWSFSDALDAGDPELTPQRLREGLGC